MHKIWSHSFGRQLCNLGTKQEPFDVGYNNYIIVEPRYSSHTRDQQKWLGFRVQLQFERGVNQFVCA